MKNSLCVIFGFIALIFFSGCTKEQTCTVSEKDGVKTYQNKNVPSDPNLKILPRELFTIYGADESNNDSSRLIQNISSFDVDSKNDIYILDNTLNSVKKFDSRGNYIKSFGRTGTGPGESVYSSNIVILNDTIIYADHGAKKMLKFDKDGTFIENINIKTSGMPSFYKALDKNKIIGYQELDEKVGDDFYSSYNLTIMDNEFNKIKELTDNRIKYDRETYNYFDLFQSSYAISDSLILYADNSDFRYKINIFDFNGNLKAVITKNYIKTQFSEAEFEDFIKKYGKVWYLTNKKSKYKNAIRLMKYDKYDRLWVFSSLKRDEKNQTDLLVDIFKDGVFLNQVKLDICHGFDYDYDDGQIVLSNDRLYYVNTQDQYMKVYEY